MPQSRPYPSDVSDARWTLISPTLEQWRHERHAGRPTEVKDSPTCARYGTPSVTSAVVV